MQRRSGASGGSGNAELVNGTEPESVSAQGQDDAGRVTATQGRSMAKEDRGGTAERATAERDRTAQAGAEQGSGLAHQGGGKAKRGDA